MNTIPVPEVAEAAVLGSILNKPDVIIDVFDKIAPSDFCIDVHRWIAEAIWDCFTTKITPTYAAVVEKLRARDRFGDELSKTAVTFKDIDAIIGSVVDSDSRAIVDHIQLVRDASFRRTGVNQVEAAAKIFCDMERNVDQIEREVFDKVGRAFDGRGGRDASVSAVGRDEQDRIDRMSDDSTPGIGCGLTWLDDLTGGFLPAEAWVIAAPYKMRKTTLALNMIMACARQEQAVSVFTVGDSSRGATYLKLVSMVMNRLMLDQGFDRPSLSGRALRYPLHDDEYRAYYHAAREIVDSWPIRLYDGQDKIGNMPEASRILRRDVALYNTRVFVFDYAQAVYSGKNDYERTSAFVTWMQQMIGEYGLTGIAISQLNEETIKSNADSYSPGAKGGGALPAMANVFIVTRYLEPHITIELKLARDSRTGDKMKHLLNPASGLVLDDGTPVKTIDLNG